MDDDQLQRLRDLAIALQVTRGGRPLVAEAVDEIDRLRVTIDTLTAEAVEANKAYNDAESQLLAEDAEIERLRALINALDIVVMHPHMDGHHQCSVRANGHRLTPEQWETIIGCRKDF